MSTGDKGIIVTTDIGREKKGLIEIGGLLEEYLEDHGLLKDIGNLLPNTVKLPDGDETAIGSENPANDVGAGVDSNIHPDDGGGDDSDDDDDDDIEASIKRELLDLQSMSPEHELYTTNKEKRSSSQPKRPVKPFQLITLDVPCVSFVRFHPLHPVYPLIDPVHITHSICDSAMKTNTIRSRYIRRLSPISWLAKTLAEGLEKCSTIILPPHFEIQKPTQEQGTKLAKGTTFAIRPNIRNNDKLSRDDVIRFVADKVTSLGQGRHKVDLKNYRKGILVEVYRGWIGMSVVSNKPHESKGPTSDVHGEVDATEIEQLKDGHEHGHEQEQEYEYGYEELKRFNLAEIYAEVIRRQNVGI